MSTKQYGSKAQGKFKKKKYVTVFVFVKRTDFTTKVNKKNEFFNALHKTITTRRTITIKNGNWNWKEYEATKETPTLSTLICWQTTNSHIYNMNSFTYKAQVLLVVCVLCLCLCSCVVVCCYNEYKTVTG